MSLLSFGLYWMGGEAEARLGELLLFIMVGWLALRILRLTAILQKIRERRRRGLEELDVAFPADLRAAVEFALTHVEFHHSGAAFREDYGEPLLQLGLLLVRVRPADSRSDPT